VPPNHNNAQMLDAHDDADAVQALVDADDPDIPALQTASTPVARVPASAPAPQAVAAPAVTPDADTQPAAAPHSTPTAS
jgi:hypothetical protein